jgi:putative cardiolipin synthase
MNMDARSARTNSELGLVLRSPEIASQVTGLIDDIIADGSYRLVIDPKGRLEWLSGEPGVEQVWHVDPETTLAQRFLWRMLAPFAPERML